MIIRNWISAIITTSVLLATAGVYGIGTEEAKIFSGQDLQLSGKEVISHQVSSSEYVLVFEKGFSMTIGANNFTSDKAVVWLNSVVTQMRGKTEVEYKAQVYLQDKVQGKEGKSAKATDVAKYELAKGKKMFLRFTVTGEVLVTADKRQELDPREMEFYKKAAASIVPEEPRFLVRSKAMVPPLPEEKVQAVAKKEGKKSKKKVVEQKYVDIGKPAAVQKSLEAETAQAAGVAEANEPSMEMPWGEGEEAAATAVPKQPVVKEPKFVYPVRISPMGKEPFKFEAAFGKDGNSVATIVGRFYMWQKQNEQGRVLELQADNAVVFYSTGELQKVEKESENQGILGGSISAIYLCGNVIMAEADKTVTSDEMYYDFHQKKAIALNAQFKTFDSQRGIPIYVRAEKIRQVAESKFEAEKAVVTTSEFHKPQLSAQVSSVELVDTSSINEKGEVTKRSFDADMRDVRVKYYDSTIFAWPRMRGNLERPDIPIKSASMGHDSIRGTTIETRWFFSRLLGLKEPEDTESTLDVDYYSKRGMGLGGEIDYKREDCFGRIIGYAINDHGEDDLGRTASRRDLVPPQELRGRFQMMHRQFLPYNWQLTLEASYLSDKHFLESYYRDEFDVGLPQETLAHLKRIEDNWGLSILGKTHTNNFTDTLEQLPGAEFHLAGQSLMDDKLTFYSDNTAGRFRQIYANDTTPSQAQQLTGSTKMSQEFFGFGSTRNEVDMPMKVGKGKLVPFMAGTFGYDDGVGFVRNINGNFENNENKAWLGEVGARYFPQPLWKTYPNIKSRLWDIDQIRHIIEPSITGTTFMASDSVFDQRDSVTMGVLQRLQTKRGPVDNPRTVDWMRLNTELTLVSDSCDVHGPDRYIWNDPIIPVPITQGFNRQNSVLFGPRRNNFTYDYLWQISDTMALLSDAYYDIQGNELEQFDIGVSRMVWPDLSYYIGSRYLRSYNNGLPGEEDKHSNILTFAITYKIDSRYTIIFSQQYDFANSVPLRSDIALIRRYHRVCYGITYSADESLKNQAIVFSIWPQGISELAVGHRKYMGLGGLDY